MKTSSIKGQILNILGFVGQEEKSRILCRYVHKREKKTNFHKILLIKTKSIISVIYKYPIIRASLVAQLVKNPPAMQETPVQFLAWEDPLEKG